MTNLFSMRAVRNVVVAAALAMAPAASFAGVFISVGFAPPALPVYTQPICPGDGYMWTPGYWAYGPEGYYWVPGVWVRPPAVGLLWTPGYWGWGGSAFIFHEGYWGPHVGFYGGINYGFGYGGAGFWGGRWEGGHFAYNTAVVNVNRTVIHNTYVDNVHVTNVNGASIHTSFNGGAGGIQARPNGQEQQWSHENHVAPNGEQQQHVQMAHADRSLESLPRKRERRPSGERGVLPARIECGRGAVYRRAGYAGRLRSCERSEYAPGQSAVADQYRSELGSDHSGRDAEPGESRCEHPSPGAGGPRSERRNLDGTGTGTNQPAAEQCEQRDQPRQPQRQ